MLMTEPSLGIDLHARNLHREVEERSSLQKLLVSFLRILPPACVQVLHTAEHCARTTQVYDLGTPPLNFLQKAVLCCLV